MFNKVAGKVGGVFKTMIRDNKTLLETKRGLCYSCSITVYFLVELF